jgi:hypothetical protein
LKGKNMSNSVEVSNDEGYGPKRAQRPIPDMPGICKTFEVLGVTSIVLGLVGLLCILGGSVASGLIVGLSGIISGIIFLGFKAVIEHLHFIRVAVERGN